MPLTPEQLRQLYQARVGLLLHKKMPSSLLVRYRTVESLAKDTQAVTTLVQGGINQKLAEIVHRWAINFQTAWDEGWSDFDPQDLTDLGAPTVEIVMAIGIIFTNLYVLAHTQPKDLLQATALLDESTAKLIIVNAQQAYQEAITPRPHFHQVQIFANTGEDGQLEQIGTLPPYDTAKTQPDKASEIIRILEQLGIINKPKDE